MTSEGVFLSPDGVDSSPVVDSRVAGHGFLAVTKSGAPNPGL